MAISKGAVTTIRYPYASLTTAVLLQPTVSDPHPARHSEKEDKRTFLQKVAEFINPGPDSTDELIEILAEAENNDVIGADARVML